MAKAQACDIIIDMKPTFGHCGIVTGVFTTKSAAVPTGLEVIHATSVGIIEGLWENGRAFCFRANGLTRAQASDIQSTAREIKAAASYGASRAIFKSWSGSSSFGKGALTRLQKYQTRMQNHQGVLKNVYCSELVVVAYQLGLHLDQTNGAWIGLDGKHTLPSTLKTWLTRHAAAWTCMGVVRDNSLELSAI
jgi:hypothetical protein